MKKLLFLLAIAAILIACHGTKGIEQPVELVYYEIWTDFDKCYEWQDYRYSSQSFGGWKMECDKITIPKTVNIPGVFHLKIRATDAPVRYVIWIDQVNMSKLLESGTLVNEVKEIEIVIE